MVEIAHDYVHIARTQLDTALHLYFAGEDYYSVVTLAGASEEILGKLLSEAGNNTALDSLKKDVSAVHKALFGEDLQEKQISDRANEMRNSLKHGTRGKAKAIKFDARAEAKDMLNRAVDNYYTLTGELATTMDKYLNENVSNNAHLRTDC